MIWLSLGIAAVQHKGHVMISVLLYSEELRGVLYEHSEYMIVVNRGVGVNQRCG